MTTIAVPVLLTTSALATYLLWFRPREARRVLRLVTASVRRDLAAARPRLPAGHPALERLERVLAAIDEQPDGWPDRMPRDPGPGPPLAEWQAAWLRRRVRLLHDELDRYRRASRWLGRPVPTDVARILRPPAPGTRRPTPEPAREAASDTMGAWTGGH